MFTRWKRFVTVILEVKPAWKGLSAISVYFNKYCLSVFTPLYHYRHLLFHCQHPPQVHCLPSPAALPMITRIIFPHRVLSYHFPFQCLNSYPFIYSSKAKLLCLVFKVQTFEALLHLLKIVVHIFCFYLTLLLLIFAPVILFAKNVLLAHLFTFKTLHIFQDPA